MKASKGTESIRNNTEAKQCIFRSYNDMAAINNISGFNIYIKGAKSFATNLPIWVISEEQAQKRMVVGIKMCAFFLDRGSFQSHLLISKNYQIQDRKQIQKSKLKSVACSMVLVQKQLLTAHKYAHKI